MGTKLKIAGTLHDDLTSVLPAVRLLSFTKQFRLNLGYICYIKILV